MARQKLNINIEELFPGDTMKIGEQTINICPLGIEQLATVARTLKGFTKVLSENGVTWENYSEPDSLLKISTLLLEQFPDVLAEASNIEVNDLKKLPIEIILEIVNKVIDVNIKSKETLVKNFNSLTKKLGT